jgi:hypothetical protein
VVEIVSIKNYYFACKLELMFGWKLCSGWWARLRFDEPPGRGLGLWMLRTIPFLAATCKVAVQ